MTGLGQSPRTRQRRSRIVMALLVGLLVALGAAGAIAQVGKSSLIGKLEGPEVVTDAGKWPKSFKEAPQLAELVKAGKLPPVAERIGQDPLVIKPLKEIGKYGGSLPALTSSASCGASLKDLGHFAASVTTSGPSCLPIRLLPIWAIAPAAPRVMRSPVARATTIRDLR